MDLHARAAGTWPACWREPEQRAVAYIEERESVARARERDTVKRDGKGLGPLALHRGCHACHVHPILGDGGLHCAEAAEAHSRVTQVQKAAPMQRERRAARDGRAERRDCRDGNLQVRPAMECEEVPLRRLGRAVAVEEQLDGHGGARVVR